MSWRKMTCFERKRFARRQHKAQSIMAIEAAHAWLYERRLVEAPTGISTNRWRAMVSHAIMCNGQIDVPRYED